METQQVFLVDACAVEPTGGVPVGVLPDGSDLTDDQLRAVAEELASAVVVPDGGSLRVVGPTGLRETVPAAAIATLGHQHERGKRDVGEYALPTAAGSIEAEVTADGGVWVTQPSPTACEAAVEESRVAGALGIDPAAVRDVGADLPPSVVSVGIDALVAPVNFLEHLGGATPDPTALVAVADDAGVDVVCGFTFDTLGAETACHLRAFVPPGRRLGLHTVGLETPALPAIAGALISQLFERGTIEKPVASVEQGHFADRPGRIHADAGGGLRVGGHTVTSFDGSVTVPAAEDDDIIEL